ncbi:epoxide hydrolase 3-like [Panicum miliaceum]|uniref:Epoxide hydrolase 3-like n=1 Tax=Panicum miliaceum TaxID=4540 RepID=A0A3L6R121_PANMI|nr:epoxide hydrolase 3-like [Panicum miliaceum]
MVNLVKAQKPLLHFLVRRAGLRHHTVDVDGAGTTTSSNKLPPPAKKDRPAVVLVHGFAAEGIVTWQFQVGVLAKHYDVYVPDLLYFGGSMSPSADRSPGFQAECLATALRKLGVGPCAVVGFSYGGMVSFKMAEAHPDLVRSLVVSGSVVAMTDSISETTLERIGVKSSAELLLPESVRGLKALLSIATHRKLWFPERLHRDYLEVMFTNRKERAELLEGLVVSNKDATVPVLPQKILLLWGENDNIFNIELAKTMKEQLGENTMLQSISKAGHLVHLERPCVYNRRLKEFLASVTATENPKQ